MSNLSKLSLITLLIAVFCSLNLDTVQAQAGQRDKVGLGIILGDPSGITYKNYFNSKNALDATVGWTFRYDGGLYLHADYLWHNYDLFQDMDEDMSVRKGLVGFYYGIGGRVFLSSDSNLGVRVPVGVNYLFENDPLEIFLEIAPTLDLVPSTEADVSGGIGIRYYF